MPAPLPSAAAADPVRTDDLLLRFIDAMADDPYEAPTLVGFPPVDPADQPVLVVIQLDDPDRPDPIEAMLGMQIPHDWVAVAFCSSGTGRTVRPPDDRADDQAEDRADDAMPPLAIDGERVRMIHGVRRDGSWSALARTDAGQVMRSSGRSGGEPLGHVDDVLRCMLGLATAPPLIDTIHLWAGIWLSVVSGHILTCDSPQGPAWRELAELHPALLEGTRLTTLLGGIERPAGGGDDLVEAGWAWAALHDWDDIRLADDLWLDHDPPPFAVHGRWLDAGAFSRLAMVGGGPLVLRLERITGTAVLRWGSGYARRLRADLDATLQAWSVDPHRDPSLPSWAS